MQGHEENGLYLEQHYLNESSSRAASGSTLFYVPKGESTLFHRIDCDEYWCYHAGAPLETWTISPDGKLNIEKLGIDEGCKPFIYFPKGAVFGSRSPKSSGDGTFFTCITVPRFSYSTFELLDREQVTALCPGADAFWTK